MATRNYWAARGSANAIAVGGVALVAYFLLPSTIQRFAYDLFGASAVLAVLFGVKRNHPAHRWSWLTIAGAIALIVGGDLTYSILSASGDQPFPSLADVFYLAGSVGLILGVASMAPPEEGRNRAALLDSILVAAAGSIIVWRVLVDGPIDSGTDLKVVALAAAYPVLDFVLCGVLFRHLLGSARRSPATILLLAGIAAWLCADLIYASMSVAGTYTEGSLIDAGWLVGYVLIGAAALQPSMARRQEQAVRPHVITNGRMFLIVVALTVPFLSLATTPIDNGFDLASTTIGSLVLIALVVARLFGSLVRSRTLLSEADDLRQALTVRANTDALTNLPNRTTYVTALGTAIEAAPIGVVVAFIDLDRFKEINDTWGHAAGDEVLLEVSRRVRAVVPADALVARLGGDELAVLARMPTGSAGSLAQTILTAFDDPFSVNDASIAVHPSVGIAVGPALDATQMLREADIAMYDAKRAGGGRWSVYRDDRLGGVVRSYRLAVDLEHALERGQMRVEYQPIVALLSGDTVGVEALVRWDHPIQGLIGPAVFIPIAEAAGTVGLIDRWVMAEAAAQVAEWIDLGLWTETMRCHVNVAPSDVADPGLVKFVRDTIAASGIPASSLSIEVTESAALDGRTTRRCLDGLHELGVGIALDDFGTRYAVLGSLATLPFGTLKIDRTFVGSLDVPVRARLLQGIVRLADSLGLATIAEGIETEAQARQVIAAGCRYGQGYLFAKPMRPEAVAARLAEGVVAAVA